MKYLLKTKSTFHLRNITIKASYAAVNKSRYINPYIQFFIPDSHMKKIRLFNGVTAIFFTNLIPYKIQQIGFHTNNEVYSATIYDEYKSEMKFEVELKSYLDFLINN